MAFYGQERNLGTWAIGKLNLYLHNMNADLRRGNTLVEPLHLEQDSVRVFDRVIANPPFSAKQWWTPLEVNLKTKVGKDGKEKEVAPTTRKRSTTATDASVMASRPVAMPTWPLSSICWPA